MPYSRDPLLPVIESFGEVFWIRTATGAIVYANQEFEVVYRLSRAQLYSNSDLWLERVHPEDRPTVARLWRRCRSFEVEYRIVSAGETVRWIWQKTCPVRDAAQPVQYFVGLHRDITQRKQAEAILTQQAERERALNQVTAAIRSSLDLDTVLSQITQVVGELMPVDHVAINQFSPQPQIWQPVAEYRATPQTPSVMGIEVTAVGNPFTQRLLRGEYIQVDDTRFCQDDINRQIAEVYGGAWLIVPLTIDQHTWGSLSLNIFGRPYRWQAEQVRLVQNIAEQVEIAIHQAQLYRQGQQELAERRRIEATLRERETFLRSIYEATQTSIFIIDVDAEGDFHYVAINPIHEQRIGLSSDYICGKQPQDIMTDADAAAVRRNYQRCLETKDTLVYEEFLPLNGIDFWWLTSLTPLLDSQGEVHRIIGTCADISALKQVEQQLAYRVRWERLLRTITEDIRQSLDLDTILATAVYDIRLTLKSDRVLVLHLHERKGQVIKESVQNHASVEQMPQPQTPLPDSSYEFYCQGMPQVVLDATDPHSAWLREFFQAAGVQSQMVAPIVKDGEEQLWGLLIVQACDTQRQWESEEANFLQQIANQLAIAIHQSDLYKQLQAANQQLTHLSIHDPLTQLLNRRAFDSALEREWQRSIRSRVPLTLMLLDIDYFKLYNDSYGHPVGDDCLVRIAQALTQAVNRPGDVVARYGGEEFILLMPGTGAAGARRLSQKIMTAIRQLAIPHRASPISPYVTASLGVVWCIPQAGDDVLPVIAAADAALYQAKDQGRNGYVAQPWQPRDAP